MLACTYSIYGSWRLVLLPDRVLALSVLTTSRSCRRDWTSAVRLQTTSIMMGPWVTLVLVCLQNVLLYLHTCKGSVVECVCTTAECQRDGRTTCEALHVCYVQYMSPVTALEEVHAVRGCIDDRTPLLCENRRPQAYTGSWPVLHCCREKFCNKDIMPTEPTWLLAANENPIKESKPNRNLLPDLNRNSELEPMDDPVAHGRDRQSTSQDGDSQFQQTRANSVKTINPLYIGVPVAGACVLLAIIIFAIYVLKRQHQYMEDYRYHSNMRGPPPCPHKAVISDLDSHQLSSSKNTFYCECERSSSGSETKLLMKV